MKTAPIALSLAFVLAGCVGIDDIQGNVRTPNDHVGNAWLMGEPRYPKAELAQGVTGVVTLEGWVDGTGELKDASITPDSPASQPFADSVRDALPMWRFYAPLNEECQPTHDRIKVTAWFEIENGKGKVYVLGQGPKWTGDKQPVPVKTRKPTYPYSSTAYRWQDGAIVFAKATIDPAGNVIETTATAYPRGLPWLMMPFEDQARIAVLDFKFPPAPAGSTKLRYYCTDLIFRADAN
jgi:TonB family protein